MGDGLATTASDPEDDAFSSHHHHLSPPPPSLSRDLVVDDDDITNADSAAGADDLIRTNDLISSSYIAPASSPHGSHIDEPILVPNSHDIRSACSAIAEQSQPSSVRTARRLQRQLNTQLRITRSQLESISAQVEEMIASEDLCKLVSPSTSAPSASRGPVEADEMQGIGTSPDEGFCDGGEDTEDLAVERLRLTFRKAGDHRGVRKNVGGTDLLFARPRMRKKIMRRRRPEERPEESPAV